MSTAQNSLNLPCEPKSVILRPSAEELRRLTQAMPTCQNTAFDNVNVSTKVLARSKASTYLVSDQDIIGQQTITRSDYANIVSKQNKHIKNKDMLVIDGYIGHSPDFKTGARLIIEKEFANIAAMQSILYYPLQAGEEPNFEPEITIIYTPSLKGEGYPNDRVITCDLEAKVGRVLNSDYFGESKKGGLRILNKLVYDRGGLALHAGCKSIPVNGEDKMMLIVGLSGTGKTTTTFTRQNNSQPIQDDFVALMADGTIHATENGCFAKTYGLDPDFEPAIHKAVTSPEAYLENVSQNEAGELDFFDESYTQNGRAVIRMADIDGATTAENKKADFLLILNRNENIIPGVARLNKSQAAAYFMLGETQGTAAGGKEEAGKFLRVPGTNPFFPMPHKNQGNRFKELMDQMDLKVYLLNTGRVGGPEDDANSKKVKIPHSSAIVKGIAEDSIEWEMDEDFGYEVAKTVPGIDEADFDILQPKSLYQNSGRQDEYQNLVNKLKAERQAYLQSFEGLDPSLLNAVS